MTPTPIVLLVDANKTSRGLASRQWVQIFLKVTQ
jgi:hypothetical protein